MANHNEQIFISEYICFLGNDDGENYLMFDDIVQICSFLICVSLLLVNIIRKRKFYNPNIILYAIWTIILLFNLLNLYELNKVKGETYFYILVGLFSYFIGSLVQDIFGTYRWRINFGKTSSYKIVINYSLIYFCAVLVFLLNLIDFIISVKYLNSGYSFNQIRAWKFETFDGSTNPITSRRSFVEQAIRVVFVAPFETALLPISLIDFFQNNKKKLLFFYIILLMLNMISGGGARLGILTFLLMFVITSFIYNNKIIILKTKVKKLSKKLLIPGSIAIALVIFFTIRRSKYSIIEELYYYLALDVSLFDYWLPQLKEGMHTYGTLFMFGIIRIPYMIIEKIGVSNLELYNLAKQYVLQANKFKNVGGRVANSFVTPFYYLYADAGIFGIVGGMFIFGFFSEKYFKRVVKTRKIQDIFILLLIIRGVIYTFIRWDFISTNYAMAYLTVFIFFKRVKTKK